MGSLNYNLKQVRYEVNGKPILSIDELGISGERITVILGPNGAGKSTLLGLLSGYLRPSSGEINFGSQSITSLADEERVRSIGVLTQRSALEFPFTAYEVVAMGRSPFGLSTGDKVTLDLIQKFGISAEQPYTAMSGGERQLVQLARVVSQIWGRGSAAMMLLDEPMNSLDLKHQHLVSGLLQDLSGKGTGLVVVVHDINLAADIADDVVLMSRGKIVAAGVASEVLTPEHLSLTFEIPITRVSGDASWFRPNP